jgi:hypothetical protein
VRNTFVGTLTYDLPFLKKRSDLLGKLVGGWQLSVTTQYFSGSPGSVYTTNVDYAGTGESGQAQFWVMNGTPTVTGQFSNSAASPNTYFTTKTATGAPVFTPPAQGTFNLQKGVRNVIYGPGTQDWNAGLFKTFRINERNSFEFRTEAYDVFNHPNWSSPGYNAATSTFGKVTSKSDLSRQLQLSLRYSF